MNLKVKVKFLDIKSSLESTYYSRNEHILMTLVLIPQKLLHKKVFFFDILSPVPSYLTSDTHHASSGQILLS